MKVIHDTPEQLILENKPIWMALFLSLLGLVFFAAGLGTMSHDFGLAALFMVVGLGVGIGCNMIFIRRTQLTLDATLDQVLIKRRGWLGDTHLSWDLKYLNHAILETSRTSDTTTYRASLVINGGMDEGTHPVTVVYSSSRGHERAVDAINGWLDSHRGTP